MALTEGMALTEFRESTPIVHRVPATNGRIERPARCRGSLEGQERSRKHAIAMIVPGRAVGHSRRRALPISSSRTRLVSNGGLRIARCVWRMNPDQLHGDAAHRHPTALRRPSGFKGAPTCMSPRWLRKAALTGVLTDIRQLRVNRQQIKGQNKTMNKFQAFRIAPPCRW